MKINPHLLLPAFIFLFACSGASESSSSAADSTLTDSTHVLTSSDNLSNVWTMKLEKPISENFGLVIPDGNLGVPLYADMKRSKVITHIDDTVQIQILERKATGTRPKDACQDVDLLLSEDHDFYKVNAGGKTGWMWGYDFMRVLQMNIGEGKKKAVLMTPYYKNVDDYCTPLQSLFFYDDVNLYFIDAFTVMQQDESVRWRNQKHLTFVEPLKAGTVVSEGTPETSIYLKWGVPNGKVILTIGLREDRFLLYSYVMLALESDVADLEGEDVEEDDPEITGEVITSVCVFSDYSIGDCGHLEFDCGDFADAEFASDINEDVKTMWNDLVVSDDEGEHGNPKYVGKSFEITYKMIKGNTCGEPDQNGNYYREGPVALIMGVKLLD